MKKIVALGGSTSKTSINKKFATYVAHQLENTETEVVDLNDYELPLFSVDLEAEIGSPENAQRLNDVLDSADAIVLSLAEHNGSFPAAFKNAMDWVSRIEMKLWRKKPMLLLSTSPGGRGGASVLATAKTLFPHAGANIIADFSLPSFHSNFSKNGIQDEQLRGALEDKIRQFQQAL
ncbi:NAD(P)H-dependent oxidoreductase [bacterium SCSIO 12741]|nr:NAD(P)H-dependent oxidoreductase [bacterium SCSIO 12741]